MKTSYFFPILAFMLFASFVSHAQEIYLYCPDVTQGKGPAGHTDEVKLSSEAGGMYNDAGGKVHFLPFSLTKNFDASSPEIMLAVASGKQTPEAEIRFYNGSSVVLTFQMKAVKFENYEQASNDECPSCTTIAETIQISYQRLKVDSFAWNVITNSNSF